VRPSSSSSQADIDQAYSDGYVDGIKCLAMNVAYSDDPMLQNAYSNEWQVGYFSAGKGCAG
jgi:hypothetical protein